jgi:hypothetical protein
MLQIAHLKRDYFFRFTARGISKPVDPELPETAREIRLGYLSKL